MRLAVAAVAALALLAAPAAAPAALPLATVEGSGEVTRAQYDHWLRIAARSGSYRRVPPVGTRAYRELSESAMQLLLQNLWVRGEAAERGIVVTAEEVRREFRKQRRTSFPRPGDLRSFLRLSGFTIDDILLRIRLELRSNRLRDYAAAQARPVTDDEVRAEYDADPRWRVVAERRDVRIGRGPTRAAALAAPRRLRRSVTRGRLPAAVFRSRRGVVRWRGGWLAFRVVRVYPQRVRPLEDAAPDIRALLESEREQEALDAFVADFQDRWRARTSCRERYATEDCGVRTP